MLSRKTILIICVFVLFANLLYIGAHVHNEITKDSAPHYSYQGHDFPETLPLPSSVLQNRYYQIRESEEYPIAGLKSDPQWFSLTSSSFGYVRLGNSRRLFMVTMFHELHCLRMLNLAFEPGYVESSHIKHCLDYLRQMALCSADLTLERGDFIQQDFTVNKTGETHRCRDWGKVYQVMDDNFHAWTNNMP